VSAGWPSGRSTSLPGVGSEAALRRRGHPRPQRQVHRRGTCPENFWIYCCFRGSLDQPAAGAVTWANGPMPRCGQLSRGVRGRCASWRAGPGLPGGAAEARRSRVARSAIARDAVGALDLGEAAPQAAQRPRTPPTETAEKPNFLTSLQWLSRARFPCHQSICRGCCSQIFKLVFKSRVRLPSP